MSCCRAGRAVDAERARLHAWTHDVYSGSDLRRLYLFKMLAEELHFRRAAEAAQVAQPALSRHIGELEHDLGIKLFERNRRKVELTAAGRELLAGVSTILAHFDETTQRAREAQGGRRGALAIGSVGMVMVRQLPAIVRENQKRFPNVSVDIAIYRSADLLDALRRHRVELAFATAFEPDATLTGKVLWTFQPRVVLPCDHPLAQRPIVRLKQLDGETLFMHSRGATAYREVMALCQEQNFIPGAIKEVSPIADLETLIGLVACGLGVTILPSPLEEIHFPTVIFKPIATQQVFDVAACWRRDEDNPLVHTFVDLAATFGQPA